MTGATAVLTVFFAISLMASADLSTAQTNIDGEDSALDYGDSVGFFQLAASVLGNASSPSRGNVHNSSELAVLLKSRGKQPSAELDVLLAAVPRNQGGKIEAAAARYALHRFFSQRGWRIEGLDPEGRSWNSSSLSDVTVLRRLPKRVFDELRKGWDEHGLSADEVGLLAVTIESMLHEEASERLGSIFMLSGLPLDKHVNERQAALAVEMCLASYIIGGEVNRRTWSKLKYQHAHLGEIFPAWNETRAWARRFVIARSRRRPRTLARGMNFADASDAILAIGDAHGRFQDRECHSMKKTLMTMEDGATGRVRLADFYGDALNGTWQFQESVTYLRSNGALDEANPGNVRVIIPNYVNGLSNCIGASEYHSVCCISECEGIRSHVERSLGKPMATPEEIVATLPSATLKGGSMDPVLMLRLRRIAGDHGGLVPIFGRLFAQWLHHAYPRECEFPHQAGQTSPLDVYDMESAGLNVLAATKEMESYAAVKRRKGAPLEGVQWDHHEELFGGEDPTASRVPPLFMAFHAALLVITGLGMGWLARVASLGFRSRRSKASRKTSEAFLPPAMV